MSTVKVITTNTHVFVTTYAKVGSTIIFNEPHNTPIENAYNSDTTIRARAVAFSEAARGTQVRCEMVIALDATEKEVLSGMY